MQSSDGVDKILAEPAAGIRVARKTCGEPRANDDAVAALHHHEVSADHAVVGAEGKRARRKVERGVEARKHAILALHIVAAFGQWSERGTAQYVLGFAEAHQIREVRVSATELANGERALRQRQVFAQVRFQPLGEQLFTRADLDRIVHPGGLPFDRSNSFLRTLGRHGLTVWPGSGRSLVTLRCRRRPA